MNRKTFLHKTALATAGLYLKTSGLPHHNAGIKNFSKRLRPIGRILELEGHYVWCNSPIFAPDGKVHIFFSKWKAEKK